jgi:hypothetical protein
MGELPENLSALDGEALLEERAARDEKLRPLFRRWPALSKSEMRELRRVYAERLRIARWIGDVDAEMRALSAESRQAQVVFNGSAASGSDYARAPNCCRNSSWSK